MTNHDVDQPTVAHRLSPRARTSLTTGQSGSETGPGSGDEPTVAILGSGGALTTTEDHSNRGAALQTAAVVVRQLPLNSERTITRAAAPLLLLIAQLRNTIEQADVTALRQEVVENIDRFEQECQKLGVDAGDIIAARYILCSTIDETVLMTPWGSRSEWSSNSLLNQFHNETWGGEKVFSILERVSEEPARKLALLVLIHSCLMLGFEGRYRVLEGGRDQLEDLRNELSRAIRRYSKVKPDQSLSEITHGFQRGRRLSHLPPLWIFLALGFAILVVVRGYSDFRIKGEIAPALNEIKSLQAQ